MREFRGFALSALSIEGEIYVREYGRVDIAQTFRQDRALSFLGWEFRPWDGRIVARADVPVPGDSTNPWITPWSASPRR